MKKLCLTIATALVSVTAFAFPEYTSVPASMSKVTDFEKLVLTFSEGTQLEVTDETGFYFEDTSYTEDDVTASAAVNGNTIVVTPQSSLAIDTWWALVIDGDCLEADGQGNPDIIISFKTLGGTPTPQFPTYTVDPNWQTVEGFDKVTFTFAEGIELAATDSSDKATMKPLLGTAVMGDMTINGNVVTFSFAGVEEGFNILTIPAGVYTANGVSNPEFTKNYVVKAPFPAYEIDPGRTSVTSLNEVTLTFAEATTLIATELEDKATLTASGNAHEGEMSINDNVVTFHFSNLTNGNYTLTIPAGLFTANGTSNPAINRTYNLKKGFPEYTTTPKDFAKVENFKQIIIEFPENTPIQITNEDGFYFEHTSYDYDDIAAQLTVVGNKLTVTPATTPASDTWWGLFIDAGSFTADGADNPEMYISFKPTGGSSADVFPKYELNPDHTNVESLRDVVFTFPENTELAATSSSEKAVLSPLSGEKITGEMTIAGNIVKFRFEDVKDGFMVMNIPAGLYTANGINNPAFSFNYNVKAAFPTYKVIPADNSTVDNVEAIVISFEEGTSIEFINNADGISLDKIEGNDDEVKEINIDVVSEISDSSITITPSSVLGKGSYRLYVPSGEIIANGVTNPYTILVSFNVSDGSSVNDMIFGDTEITVFDINGSMVFKGNPNEFKRHGKQIFIVNGQKMIM